MHPDSIERYLAKRMNPEELKKFEFKMNEDSKLKQEVMELQNAIDAIKVHERSELKNRLVAREKQFEIKNSLRPFKFGIWYIFIGIIILISLCFLIKVDDKALIKNNGLSERIDSLKKYIPEIIIKDTIQADKLIEERKFLLKNKSQEQRHDTIYAHEGNAAENYEIAMQYYAAPDEIDIIRGAEILTFFDSAVIAFNAKKYSVALTYLNLSSADIDLKYYFKAIISFELKQYSKANEYFRILLRKKHETLNIQDIEWYYFLNNLACGANCKSVFESSLKIIILNTNHKYFSEVSEIIQDSKYIK